MRMGLADHRRDQRLLIQVPILQAELGVARLALAQQIARFEPELLEQGLELGGRRRRL